MVLPVCAGLLHFCHCISLVDLGNDDRDVVFLAAHVSAEVFHRVLGERGEELLVLTISLSFLGDANRGCIEIFDLRSL